MVGFGIQVTDPDVIPAILEVRKNLLVDNIVQNPFYGKITAHGNNFFTVVLNPVYPRVYYFSFFPLVVSLLFLSGGFWRTALLIVGVIMLGTSVFWSNRFYYLLFRYKTGGGIRYVPPGEALERVV